MEITEGNVYQCKICGEIFFERDHLKHHLTTHTDDDHSLNMVYQCRYCDKTFSHEQSVKAHMVTHNIDLRNSRPKHLCNKRSNQKLYICIYCDKSYKDPHKFKNHMLAHTGENPYRCNKCDKNFSNNCDLKRHYKTKGHLKLCQLRSTSPHSLPLQEWGPKFTTYGPPKGRAELPTLYQCNECGQKFCESKHLESHLILHMKKIAVDQYKCSDCSEIFSDRLCLEEHQRLAHTSNEIYKCSDCSEIFSDRLGLEAHQRMVHTSDKNIEISKCDYCEFTSLKESNIVKHMKIHYEESPFQCVECKQLLSKRSRLNNSIVKKSVIKCRKEKIYHCYQCTRNLDNRPQLHRRLIMYKEICKCSRCHCRKYKCIECNKTFTTKIALKTHLKSKDHLRATQTGETAYHCKVCDKDFSSENILAEHSLTHTREIPHQGRLSDNTVLDTQLHLGEQRQEEQCEDLEIKDEPIENKNIDFNDLFGSNVEKTMGEEILVNNFSTHNLNELKAEIKEEHRGVEGEWIINWRV